MKRTLLALSVLSFAACALLATPARAETSTASIAAELGITAVNQVSVSPSNLQFNSVDVGDFENGYTDTLNATVTVKANSSWTLKIHGSATTWTPQGSGWASKPRSDIKIKATDSGADPDYSDWTSLPAAADTIYTGSSTPVSGSPRVVNVRVLLSFTNDTPDTYSYNSIVFTLTN